MDVVTALKILAIVIGVPSGDTIVVSVDGQERQIVLAGIDAPELGQPYFEEARKSLADKVKGKKVFVQVFDKTKDGKDSAAVWLDKRSINAEMVAEGHAWYDPRHPKYKTISKAQEKAKEGKLGLWATKQPTPPWEYSKKGNERGTKDPFSTSKDKDKDSKLKLGETRELALDDGNPVGKKSFSRGHALMFKSPAGNWYLTSVRVHGARYGMLQAPDEDFHVTLCDRNFMPIKDFSFPYSKFKRSSKSEWVTLRMKPTKVPAKFVICLDFDAERTKGVYVSHDAEGNSLVALPDKPSGVFSGGDWLIRPTLKASGSVPVPSAEKQSEAAPTFDQAKVPKLGKGRELALDDGEPAGKKSFPRGHASKFKTPEGNWWLTSVRIHGARYGMPQAPREDFHITLCDTQFKPIRDFTFPYSEFKRSSKSKWKSFKVPATKVPKEFVICLNFDAESTKGVYVSHDAEGTALVGLPNKPMGRFTGGDWLIRPKLQPAE